MRTPLIIATGTTLLASLQGLADEPLSEPLSGPLSGPMYKPSSSSEKAISITSNAYGGSALAPTALHIADVAPDFELPISGGGQYQLSHADKPVAIVFYRGHW